jgi:hypothetical protein
MHLLHKNLVLKTSAAHAVLVVTLAPLAATVHPLAVAHVALQAPMPHRRMAAINPLKPPMLPKPPSSASAR